MERLKNVYKISADLEDGTTIIKHVFSHTCDNAFKKFKVANSRNKLHEIIKVNSVELLLKDVIY